MIPSFLLIRHRSRGHPHSGCGHLDLKSHFHPKGRSYLKKTKDDRASMQPAKSVHEQPESPRELCRPPKKGEFLGFSRKGNIRPKMAKKKPAAIVHIIWKDGLLSEPLYRVLRNVLGSENNVLSDIIRHMEKAKETTYLFCIHTSTWINQTITDVSVGEAEFQFRHNLNQEANDRINFL